MADKRLERSRKAIESAYIDLLQTRGNHNITISDIINTAGYSKTAFYNNFTCKEDLLMDIYKSLATEFFETLKNSSSESNKFSGLEPDENLALTLSHFIAPYETVYRSKNYYRVLYSQFGIHAIESIMNIVLEMQAADPIFANTVPEPLNAALFGYSHLWDTMGCIAWWLRHDFEYSPDYMGKQQFMRLSSI